MLSSLAVNEATDVKSGRGSLEPETVNAKAVLEELFTLLEEYGPGWYTEDHHKRAVAALMGTGMRNVCETYLLGMTA